MSIITVGTRELKNKLSEYMRRVKAGETVIITDRGKPVGKIMPIQADLTDRLKQFAETGIIEWNGERVPASRPAAVNQSKRLLSDLVAEDRE